MNVIMVRTTRAPALVRLCLTLLLACLAVLTCARAQAYEGNVVGVGSGGYVTSGIGACNGCHVGLSTPAVTVFGPSGFGLNQTVVAGSTNNTFTVSFPSAQTGGFLVF